MTCINNNEIEAVKNVSLLSPSHRPRIWDSQSLFLVLCFGTPLNSIVFTRTSFQNPEDMSLPSVFQVKDSAHPTIPYKLFLPALNHLSYSPFELFKFVFLEGY